MENELVDKIFEVRNYFIKEMPLEGTKEREILDLLDEIIDEVEE